MFFGFAQFMQFVLGYSALDTAIRTLPFAATMIAFSQFGPRLASRIGVRSVIAGGLAVTAVGLLWMSTVTVASGYLHVVGGLSLAAAGMALSFPAATEAIVTSLPQDKAGVASAVNDTTREVGAAVGIALLGSLMSSGYRRSVGDAFDALPAAAAEAARDSVGAALHVAQQAPESVRSSLAITARAGFAEGFSLAMTVGAALLVTIAVVVFRWFPKD